MEASHRILLQQLGQRLIVNAVEGHQALNVHACPRRGSYVGTHLHDSLVAPHHQLGAGVDLACGFERRVELLDSIDLRAPGQYAHLASECCQRLDPLARPVPAGRGGSGGGRARLLQNRLECRQVRDPPGSDRALRARRYGREIDTRAAHRSGQHQALPRQDEACDLSRRFRVDQAAVAERAGRAIGRLGRRVGDNGNVRPGSCRAGVVRRGNVYRCSVVSWACAA